MNDIFESGEDIVISSRIRMARNIAQFPFENKMNDQQQKELVNLVVGTLKNINLGDNPLDFLSMSDIDEYQKQSFVERHIVSREFIKKKNATLALSKDQTISIMMNEEDHIRLQVILSGLELEKAYSVANQIDDVLDNSLDYAFHDRFGYLTTCMTNLGTGLRASVMLHLPALEKAGALNSILSTISKLGLTIRGTFGEGSKAYGSIYQVSNEITLGISEAQAIENLKNVVNQIILNEKAARKKVYQPLELEDTVYRSYGILKYAHQLSTQEFYELTSNLRLGISTKFLKKINIKDIDDLTAKIGAATICSDQKKEMDQYQRDQIRAQIVRDVFALKEE